MIATRPWAAAFDEQTRRDIGDVLVSSLLVNLLGLTTPVASIVVFNNVLPHQATSTLIVVAVGMLIIHLFDAAIRMARHVVTMHVGSKLDQRITELIIAKLLRMSLADFERTAAGETYERLRQLHTIRGFLIGELPLLAVDLIFSMSSLALLLFLDWRLGALVIMTLPIFVVLSFLSERAQRRLSDAGLAADAAKSGVLNDIVNGMATIRGIGLEVEMERRFNAQHSASSAVGRRLHEISGSLAGVSGLIYGLATLAVLVVGAHLIMDNALTFGVLVGCTMLVARSLAPIRYLATVWNRLSEACQAFTRLNRVLSEASDVVERGVLEVPDGPLAVSCEHLAYAHGETRGNLLSDVTLRMEPGTITGLVGSSGCGKSTLGRLLVGLYQPLRGRVTVAGADIIDLRGDQLRRAIGYVPQECQLFNGTVLDNILLGCEDVPARQAVEAAQFTGAHRFIEQLPQGYATILGNGEQRLSVGERQLLAITRVVVRRPRVVIFDEITSALDSGAERALMTKLRRATRSARLTVLVITHRSSTLAACDRVAVLSNGKIAKHDPVTEMSAGVTEQAVSAPVRGQI